MVGGVVVRDRDEALDPPGLCIAAGEEFLMLLHRGLQHLGRQAKEVLADLAHQHDRPFDKPRDLGQKAPVLHHLQPGGEGRICGVVPDMLGPFLGVQHHLCALQLRRVILEGGYRKCLRRKEAVAARGVARGDAVDIQRYDLSPALVAQQTKDRMQRPHPAQAARAPAH